MVVISSEIPPAGFQPQSTPSEVMRASADETSVTDALLRFIMRIWCAILLLALEWQPRDGQWRSHN